MSLNNEDNKIVIDYDNIQLTNFSKKDYKKGLLIKSKSKMVPKNLYPYEYKITAKYGNLTDINSEFKPDISPKNMLGLGIFEGKYLNDCIEEFPKEWFTKKVIEKLSPEKPDISLNCFNIKSRLSRNEWIKKGWIPIADGDPDLHGWFIWYCRAYCGRRLGEIDNIQYKRWKAFKRHVGQIKKNCKKKNIECRPKQRQAILQWAYDPFI